MALGVAAGSRAGERMEDHATVRMWLAVVALLVLAMVAVGGATRLTDSGLSITEWQPILGAIPPLSEADWRLAFEKYKQIPEYREVNSDMSLAGFKFIYWWEWAHRFLGRVIGLVFALPLMWFWLRGQIPPGYGPRLVLLLLLGGVQGFVGWYMVQSGLSDRVDVSQYRLALHLCLAFVILGALVWTFADLRPAGRAIYFPELPAGAGWLAAIVMLLVLCQVALGAFVAGTKAGLVHTTWPLMDGQLIPDGLYALVPWYMSATEDHLTIQFNHRVAAYLLIGLVSLHAVRLIGIDDTRVSRSAWAVWALIVAQSGLGIWTLLAVDGAIPIGLGVTHQTLAAIVFAASVWHFHAVTRTLKA